MPSKAKENKKNKKRCNLIVLSAPSGAGKTTICDELLKQDNQLAQSVSATTRLPRGQEKDGQEYYFFSEKTFAREIKKNKFLEWAQVHGFYYGTLKKEIKSRIAAGKDILLDIDVQGGLAIKQQMPDAILIFVQPPSMAVLEKRLKGRGTDTGSIVNKRLVNARWETKQSKYYDYLVVNDKLEQAVKDVRTIIRAERLKV